MKGITRLPHQYHPSNTWVSGERRTLGRLALAETQQRLLLLRLGRGEATLSPPIVPALGESGHAQAQEAPYTSQLLCSSGFCFYSAESRSLGCLFQVPELQRWCVTASFATGSVQLWFGPRISSRCAAFVEFFHFLGRGLSDEVTFWEWMYVYMRAFGVFPELRVWWIIVWGFVLKRGVFLQISC